MQDQGLPATVAPQNDGAAIKKNIGEAYMSKFNWRSSSDFYQRVEAAETTGLAWECLRRNPSFQQDCRDTPKLGAGVGTEFRQNWGLVLPA
jgi:hypothetical protein